MQSSHSRTPKIIGALAIAVVVGVGGFLAMNGASALKTSTVTTTSSSGSTSQTSTSTTPTTTAPTTPSSSAGLAYKDGTYNATARYRVPGGQNSLIVTLSIVGDTITAVKTTSSYDDRESASYIDSFDAGISSAVVGTSLSDAFVSRVGGATLTTGAFDDTLQTIMNDAKA